MKQQTRKFAALLPLLGALAGPAVAEDIDIFTGGASNNADNPNVLIVIDNSSNWASNNQNWPADTNPPVPCEPNCNKQGYYELKAIRSVLTSLTSPDVSLPINIGLMLFNNSTATRDGGYVRYHLRQMTPANRQDLIDKIDLMIQNFNTETTGSSVQYGAMLFDVFKYFGGFTNPDNATTDQPPPVNPTYSSIPVFGTQFWGSNNADSTKPDAQGYSGANYLPPALTSCGRNYVVFIGNGFPAKDDITSSNMYEVLRKLTNPSNPDTPVDQLPLETQTTSTSCDAVTSGSGAFCQSENTCKTSSLASYTNTTDITYECRQTTGCSGNTKYKVNACTTKTTSSYGPPTGAATGRYADEYADFIYSTDVNAIAGQQRIVTYAIDVYRDQQDFNQTQLMRNMATAGGGKYFAARDENAIIDAFKQIVAEIQAVNTTFASASLPVNATNRAQNENQVFIGMFRPDADSKPRWFGNLKRYQLGFFGTRVDLADKDGAQAVNPNTGFITECASSFWTTDSGNYFENILLTPSPASRCLTSAFNKFSDAPDGPFVEKGAAGEVLRKGNNPPQTDTAPTWAVNRTLYTVSGNSLIAYSSSNSGLSENDTNFIRGLDVNDDSKNGVTTDTRPAIHGDVVHSRPIPVNYGTGNVTVYYGANDGTYRAVDAATGKEKWALIAPEFPASAFSRLNSQAPLIKYPNSTIPDATAKNYFWDGSTGIFQTLDNSRVWLFPTMRRGGRMIYGLDVTNSATPVLKWRVGCPNLTDDSGCTPGFEDIGQTWSMPAVARIKGYDVDRPVIIVGGGYDRCEDADTATPSCSTSTGNKIYVLDADTGALIRSFETTRGVAADISLIDVDFDRYVDYAYGADLGGNIWRISFVNPADTSARASGEWTVARAAYTNGSGRKFFYGPALLPYSGEIYLALGSGDREHPLETQYPYTTPVTNRFYVYLDDPKKADTEATDLDSEASMRNFTADTTSETEDLLPGEGYDGWFMDLNQNGRGEQTVTSAVIIGGLVTFSTNRPLPSTNTCATALGEARGYWVNLLNSCGAIGASEAICGGVRSSVFTGGGLPPSPVVGTVTINGEPVTVVIGAVDKQGGASSPIGGQEAPKIGATKRKRVYWRTKGDN
jgi:type IV pilus assembly protein PilY1